MRAAVVVSFLAACRIDFDPLAGDAGHLDAASDGTSCVACSAKRAHWTFDEGAGPVARDSVADYPLALANGATWSPGRSAGAMTALELDGVDDRASADRIAALEDLPAFSFTAWIRPRSDGLLQFGVIIAKGGVGMAGVKRFLVNGGSNLCTNDHCLELNVNRATIDGGSLSTSNAVVLDAWQFVATTYDPTSGTAHLYANGVETSYIIAPTSGSGALTSDTATPYSVGGWPAATASTGYFDGAIDDLQVFDRALTGAEVAAIYAED